MESFLRAVNERTAAASGAKKSLPLPNETAAAAASRGMRSSATFSYRGINVEYSELPDADSNLLFGNVCWPCAETLARLLIDAAKGGAKLWTAQTCMAMGVPLDMLLQRRFGVRLTVPPPTPGALELLGVGEIIPDVSSGGVRVLEVGAGVGLTGLAAHALGASVLLTDGEARLVEALRSRHADAPSASDGRLRFETLDWYAAGATEGDGSAAERFELILGVEVLNPACEGEVHVPRLIKHRLSRAAGARAMLLSEVRRNETCRTAVIELALHGLRVAAFQVCNGRELFEVALDALPEVGAQLLLVATWPPDQVELQ